MAVRPRHRFGNLIVLSELPIVDLPPAEEAEQEWLVRVGRIRSGKAIAPYHTWLDAQGRPAVWFARDADRRIVKFVEGACFSVDEQRRVIVCEPTDALPAGDLSQLLVHEVLPLVASLTHLTLHASVVALDGHAVAFAGRSGAGKSTLALRTAQRGAMLLSDDITIVDARPAAPVVLPMQTPVRLWPDSVVELLETSIDADALGKRRLSSREAGVAYADNPMPLRRLFLVASDGPDRPARLTSHAAAAAILEHAFVLAPDDRRCAERLFDQVIRTLQHVDVFRIAAPARFAELDVILDAALGEALA